MSFEKVSEGELAAVVRQVATTHGKFAVGDIREVLVLVLEGRGWSEPCVGWLDRTAGLIAAGEVEAGESLRPGVLELMEAADEQ